ncbi:nuclear transport factor 2 family protein [Streptomyces sp. NBC_01498]|uniref:nuclear transport factor 2 family protein n=1 Tax=Streptomyces sp. NBC_01498 TaxID=2975870 RepID=UPI002E7B71F3|nr:nuclear transport factor 2 family protein [Streptomyces sp. NBC_01498]WTL27034.1 nuclear transport factor 2 family protein [Streptomyces sp. NBC_01498]
MTDEQTWDLVRRYHEAWTTTKDFAAASRLLAENLETDLPVNAYADKREFVEAIRSFGENVSSVRLLSACTGPGDALMVYDLVLDPIGTLRIAEQFKVAEGRITFIRQVHDTATMRAAGFAPPLPR